MLIIIVRIPISEMVPVLSLHALDPGMLSLYLLSCFLDFPAHWTGFCSKAQLGLLAGRGKAHGKATCMCRPCM